MRTAIFTGTFNPFTTGHEDIVERALTLFDRIVIGVGYNISKDTDGSGAQERAAAIKAHFIGNDRVEVATYSDLTADFARRHDAVAIIRGVRNTKDYEYEREQAHWNRILGNGLETVILFASPDVGEVSSSVVRELHHFGRDVRPYLPEHYRLSPYTDD